MQKIGKIIIIINERTPTINRLYLQTRDGRRFKSQRYVDMKKDIMATTIKQAKEQGFVWDEWKERLLKVRVTVHEDWWTKKNTVKKKDISNKEKYLIDCITAGLGLEDSYIWEHTFVKHDVGLDPKKWKSVVSIEVYKAPDAPLQ